MTPIPYHRFKIVSAKSPDAILAVVSDHLGYPQDDSTRFRGGIRNTHFHIKRAITYRNSFLPIVDGDVAQQGHGSIISVSMRLSYLVVAFMTVWLGMTVYFGAYVFSAFGYALMTGCFWFEANKQDRMFRELLS